MLFLHFCSQKREQASQLNPKYSPFYSAGAECARGVFGWLRERPSRRGVGLSAARAPRRAALLRRRQPLFRAGAWRRAAASIAGVVEAAACIGRQ